MFCAIVRPTSRKLCSLYWVCLSWHYASLTSINPFLACKCLSQICFRTLPMPRQADSSLTNLEAVQPQSILANRPAAIKDGLDLLPVNFVPFKFEEVQSPLCPHDTPPLQTRTRCVKLNRKWKWTMSHLFFQNLASGTVTSSIIISSSPEAVINLKHTALICSLNQLKGKIIQLAWRNVQSHTRRFHRVDGIQIWRLQRCPIRSLPAPSLTWNQCLSLSGQIYERDASYLAGMPSTQHSVPAAAKPLAARDAQNQERGWLRVPTSL